MGFSWLPIAVLTAWLVWHSVESFQQVNTLYQSHGSTFPASTHFQGNPGSATFFLAAVDRWINVYLASSFCENYQNNTNNTFKHFTIEFKVCACRPICLATRKCELMCLWVLCLFEFYQSSCACVCVNVSCVSGCVCVWYVCVSLSLFLSHSVYVGCIIGCSRPDSARGVHQAVTRRDREESWVAVRRPF